MGSPRIILTGGSKGLGLAILRILLERYNARVATLSRSYPDELKSVVEKYGPERVIIVQGDVAKSEDNVKVVNTAVEAFGGLDSLILNAATLDPVGEQPSTPTHFDKLKVRSVSRYPPRCLGTIFTNQHLLHNLHYSSSHPASQETRWKGGSDLLGSCYRRIRCLGIILDV
jgi:NAD(P)-dependent dehydrogenase (short-subunit alcohol dehydrogenase family)